MARVRFVRGFADPERNGNGNEIIGVVVGQEGEYWDELQHPGNRLTWRLPDGRMGTESASNYPWNLTEVDMNSISIDDRAAILFVALKRYR